MKMECPFRRFDWLKMTQFAVVLMFIVIGVRGFILPDHHRHSIETLKTTNGHYAGFWQEPQYCGMTKYAVGYQIKVEAEQGSGDDTGLNGISLICATKNGTIDGYITSGVGHFGTWHTAILCPEATFMYQFDLRVEELQDPQSGDDTGVNDIKLMCGPFGIKSSSFTWWWSVVKFTTLHATGGSPWGDWALSGSCPSYTAICGIATKVQAPQPYGDDKAMTDVQMYCCDD